MVSFETVEIQTKRYVLINENHHLLYFTLLYTLKNYKTMFETQIVIEDHV